MLLPIFLYIILHFISKFINFYYKFIYLYNYLTFEDKQKYFESILSEKISLNIIKKINKPFQNLLTFLMFFIYSLIKFINIKEKDIENLRIEKYSEELIEEQFEIDLDNNLILLKNNKYMDIVTEIKNPLINNNIDTEIKNPLINNNIVTEIEELLINNNIENKCLQIENSLYNYSEFFNKDEININEINFGDFIKNLDDGLKEDGLKEYLLHEDEINIIKKNDLPYNIENTLINIQNNLNYSKNNVNENIQLIKIIKKKK